MTPAPAPAPAPEPERPRPSAPAADASRAVQEPESIDVIIDSEPAGAQVVLGGRVLGTTPYHGELTRRDREVALVIRLAGYTERTVVARASRAIRERVTLVRGAPAKPSRPDRDRSVNPF